LWASGGDILDPGDIKYQTGWGVEVPPRQWENYIQNKQDQAIAHINQHGIAVWDAETEYQADTSYTQGQTNGTIYRAKVTHSGQNPELDTLNTYWDIAFAAAGDFYTKAEVDADFLAKDQNLGDLSNTATARNNLNVYAKSETYNKTEVDGKTTIASALQAQEQISNTVLLSALRLADAFKGSNQNLSQASGKQELPGGLIFLWGTATATGTTVNISLGANSFPNGVLFAVATDQGTAPSPPAYSSWNIAGTTSSNLQFIFNVKPEGMAYFAIGY
jgi:hypothetical protein